jgi:transposase-like protein
VSLARDPKFTEEQKYEIALELVSGNLSHAGICRKWDISTTYAYKLKDRALELLRQGMGRPAGKPDVEVERLQQRVTDLEQLAGDQALAIRALKKTRGHR